MRKIIKGGIFPKKNLTENSKRQKRVETTASNENIPRMFSIPKKEKEKKFFFSFS